MAGSMMWVGGHDFRKPISKLSGLYDLDLFSLNTALGDNINLDNQFPCRVNSRYYSPHT